MTPHCYDRPPFRPGYWAPNGPGRLRWIAFRMTAECMAWTAHGDTVPAPQRDGWDCDGCRHDPRGRTT